MCITNLEKIHLDVYRGPWIDAIYQDGHVEKLSLRDCLVQAKNIKSLDIFDANYALDKTVPYTLLTMILGRVFYPSDSDKLVMLANSDGFDMEPIDLYIEECEEKSISFDVFDEHYPFLQDWEYQTRQEAKKDKKKVDMTSIGILDPLMVSGNNTVFYHNKNYDTGGDPVQDILFMTPPQYIASVARNHMYHNPSGQSCGTGYSPSQPPLHCIIHGKNLFETLIISIPNDLCGVPLWERKYDMTVPEIVDQYEEIDYISAAFLPTTSIRFGKIENGMVKNIFYNGNIYKGKDKEKPKEYASLFCGKTKTGMHLLIKEMKKKNGTEPIPIGMGDSADFTSTKLQIMQNFDSTNNREFVKTAIEEDLLDGPFQFVIYGGKLAGTGVEPQSMLLNIPFPMALLNNDVCQYVKGIAAYVEVASVLLLKALLKLEKDIQNGEEVKASGAVRTITRHFSEYACDQLTENKLVHDTWLEQIIQNPTDEKKQEIIELVQDKVMESYYSYRTKYILLSAKYAAQLQRELRKI